MLPSFLRPALDLDASVGRKSYVWTGVVLMFVKLSCEWTAYRLMTGEVLGPLQMLSPLERTGLLMTGTEHKGLILVLVAINFPMLWVGVTMSVRRSADAGFGPWHGLWFFVPFVNYLMILGLSVAPTRSADAWREVAATRPRPTIAQQLGSMGLGVGVGVVGTAISVLLLGQYAAGLFLGVPFLMGLTASFALNRKRTASLGQSLLMGMGSVILVGGALLAFALEGLLCIAMAVPVAVPLALLGAALGHAVGRRTQGVGGSSVSSLAMVPVFMLAHVPPPSAELRPVVTTIEIDAAAPRVWESVVAFGELPPPSALWFRVGIAYPTRARIEGRGVGAVRYCEFSTGPFVEPITRWEPPRELAFDVVAQPAPLEEWSPYEAIHPPHLDGYFRSVKGRFRLTPIDAGRTRLEGTTWYELDLHPRGYWMLWSDALMHAIHRRVLEHIAREATSRA